MKTVTIDVTREDIDNGLPKAAFACMLALAGTRAFNKPPGKVGCNGIDLCIPKNGTELHNIRLDPDTYQKVKLFDARMPLEPFSFTVEVPEELLP